jgi:hypothetical protein
MKDRLIGLLLIIILLGGCTKKTAGPEVEMIDGVEYVHNAASPLRPGLAVEFQEELSFGGDAEPKEAVLYRPGDILVDENDLIYVSDYQDAMIKVFDPQGNFVRAIGRKGQGPGEFQSISAMRFLPDGQLLVFDQESRRTSLFDRAGSFIKSHSWRNWYYQILMTDGSGYVADENIYVYGEERKLFVKKYDFEGNELENWGEFTPMGWKTQTKGQMTISITTPYTPQSIFASDPACRRLYHCHNDTYAIEAYDGPGRLVRKFDRPYEPVPFTKKDAEDYYAAFDRRNNKVISEMAREVELPKVKTVADDMFVDDRENLWVATNELDASTEPPRRAFDIFNPEGAYTCRLWLDFHPGVFVRGKMYRLDSNEETGDVRVKRYSVTWSE